MATLVKVSRDEIVGYKHTKVHTILLDFERMDADIVRVDGVQYANAATGASAFNQSIKRFKLYGIRAFSRDGKIYLEKVRGE